MDSGNSGSAQSSSCGDEDYDVSRSEPSFAALLSPSGGNTSTDFAACFALHQRRRQRFSPPSTFFDSLARPSPEAVSPAHFLNLDPSWTQSCTHIAGSLTSNHVPPPPLQPPLAPSSVDPPTSNPASKMVGMTVPNPSLSSSDQASAAATATTPRGSKKRPRASRRAPTTVLTTDTSNFRQMVQEFTGIPSPPFSSPVFPRARFDLFNSAAAASSIRSSPVTGGLLRPFAQKISIPTPTPNPNLSFSPFAAISSSAAVPATVTPPVTAINPSTTTMINTTTASVSAPSVCAYQNSTCNYQQPTDLGSLTGTNEGQSLLHHSQLLTYRSLFGSSQNYNLSSLLGSKAPAPTTTSMPLEASASDQYNGDPSVSHMATRLFGSERASSRGGGGDGDDLFGWGDGSGIAGGGGGDQAQFRPPGGHYRSSSSINGCKMNRTASSTSTELHAENRSDNNVNNTSRAEGTFDSWICSSSEYGLR